VLELAALKPARARPWYVIVGCALLSITQRVNGDYEPVSK
jgi:hypothetical protein